MIERALERLRTLSPRKFLEMSADAFYTELVTIVAEVGDTRMGSLYLSTTDENRLVMQAAVGLPEIWIKHRREVPVDDEGRAGPIGRAAAARQMVVASDFREPWMAPVRDVAAQAGLGAIWVAPLVNAGGKLLGALATYYPDAKLPTPSEAASLQSLAREAVHVIEAALVYYGHGTATRPDERVHSLARQLMLQTSPQAVFAAIVRDLKQLREVDFVWLQYVSDNGDVRFFQSETVFDSPPLFWSSSPCRRALESGGVVCETDYDPSLSGAVRAQIFLNGVIAQPLELVDDYIILSAGWQLEHAITAEDREIIDLYAKLGGLAVQNAIRNEGLRMSYHGMVRGLLWAMEIRDYETIAHSQRVVTYTLMLAEKLGIQAGTHEQIALGAVLHDVGKIGIPDAILLKPGKLTDQEFSLVRRHPVIGHSMLLHPLVHFPVALDLVRYHHERFDGVGYPDGLAGQEIPLPARALAVADAFDVMTTERPYNPVRSIGAASNELLACSSRQFCPKSVEAFLEIAPSRLAAVRQGELNLSPFADLFAADL